MVDTDSDNAYRCSCLHSWHAATQDLSWQDRGFAFLSTTENHQLLRHSSCRAVEMLSSRHLQLVAGWEVCALSMPGSAFASFRNSALILKPAFALLSINIISSFVARSSPSSTDTCLFSERSVLFPTRTIITSFPRSFLTSSIHFEVFKKDARSVGQKNGILMDMDMSINSCLHWFGCKLGIIPEHFFNDLRSSTYLLYRILQRLQRNPWYRKESRSGTFLVPRCPITVNEQSCLPDTSFSRGNLFQSLPTYHD